MMLKEIYQLINDSAADGAAANKTDKKAIFKNCALFTNCISKINNTQIANTENIDIVMSMYNLIEYSNKYSYIWKSMEIS